MSDFTAYIDQLNQKAKHTGWCSQLLENLAESRKITMSEVFSARYGDKTCFSVPAKCIGISADEIIFEFADGSTISVPPSKIIH